ncbi:MAG: hypothetical protein QXL94_00850 [Candidatus Parvarchaeum sp.]
MTNVVNQQLVCDVSVIYGNASYTNSPTFNYTESPLSTCNLIAGVDVNIPAGVVNSGGVLTPGTISLNLASVAPNYTNFAILIISDITYIPSINNSAAQYGQQMSIAFQNNQINGVPSSLNFIQLAPNGFILMRLDSTSINTDVLGKNIQNMDLFFSNPNTNAGIIRVQILDNEPGQNVQNFPI